MSQILIDILIRFHEYCGMLDARIGGRSYSLRVPARAQGLYPGGVAVFSYHVRYFINRFEVSVDAVDVFLLFLDRVKKGLLKLKADDASGYFHNRVFIVNCLFRQWEAVSR